MARWLPDQNRYAYWNLNPGDGPQEPEADITTIDAGVDEPPVGVGFFARTVSTTQVQLLGRSERRPVYRIPLRTGFNMIGNPYPFRVPWNTVSIEVNGREVVALEGDSTGGALTVRDAHGRTIIRLNGDSAGGTIQIDPAPPVPPAGNPVQNRVRTNIP